MKLLLDTHVLIWWTLDEPMIAERVREQIVDPANVKLVSAISAIEISTKVRIGKLPQAASLAATFEAVLDDQGFEPLALTVSHGRLAGSLPGEHKDPFDRMLAAQALLDGLVIVSADAVFDRFGVQRLW